MKFDYAKPSTYQQLHQYLLEGGKIFAGGTDVFVKIRAGILKPQLLIDSKGIKSEKIAFENQTLTIHMNNTYSELLEDEDVLNKYPILGNIVSSIGSTQIRNKGTMIGNIVNASPAGDFLLACYLYDAKVNIQPSNRTLNIKDFVKGPSKVSLEKGEFVSSISLPYLDKYQHYYEKLGRRNEMIISIASIGVLLKTNNNVIEDIKIAYGSVGPTIVRFEDLEKEFIGKNFEIDLFESMAEKYQERIKPIDDVRGSAEYRKKMVKNLLIKSYYKLAGDYK